MDENYDITLADEGKAYEQGFDDGKKSTAENILQGLWEWNFIPDCDVGDIYSNIKFFAEHYDVKLRGVDNK